MRRIRQRVATDQATSWERTATRRCDRADLEKVAEAALDRMGLVPAHLEQGKPAMKDEQRSAQSTAGKASAGFSDEERAAIRERAREQKTAARRGASAKDADGESELLAKIAEMAEPDRGMAERLHAVIKASAPSLSSTTWYGQPAYAKDGKVVCFFQPAAKFKTRYATLGFSDRANLDDGDMWPTYYALKKLTAADEARIGTLVQRAAS
jgi:hypothetical protein